MNYYTCNKYLAVHTEFSNVRNTTDPMSCDLWSSKATPWSEFVLPETTRFSLCSDYREANTVAMTMA